MPIHPNPILSKFQNNHSIVWENLFTDHINIYPCQKEALRDLKEYFDNPNNSEIALIVQPTGTGKSGIAALVPYILSSKNVLVITPSVIITKQLYNSMCGKKTNVKTFYEERNIIVPLHKTLFVEEAHSFIKSIRNDEFASMARQFNLIIANAHKFGESSNVDIGQIPRDLFDTVIVDEAHHYPAETWKKIIDHFRADDQRRIKKVFLTATPFHGSGDKKKEILDDQAQKIAYELSRHSAIQAGIIRGLDFEECDKNEPEREVIETIIAKLREHDANNNYIHQAMILVRKKEEADRVEEIYNINPNKLGFARAYYGINKKENFEDFRQGRNDVRVLVVCGKATEGFDRKEISVVGILRNLGDTVLFSQFVGRCVRYHPDDPTGFKCCLVSHKKYKQRENIGLIDAFIAEVDPEDDEIVENE